MKNVKTEKEYIGIKAMQKENYMLPIENEVLLQKSDSAWWSTPVFIIFLTISMSVLDALVLYDILDQASYQAEYMSKVISFGVALILNMIPILIAKFAHQAIYRIKRLALVWVVLLVTVFLILFSATVFLRFAYQDKYGSSSEQHITNEMIITEERVEQTELNVKGLAVVMLLSVEPMVTSVVNFFLAFISDDELRKRINHLRKRLLELDVEERDLRALLAAAEDPEIWKERTIAQDVERKRVCAQDIVDRGEILKAKARSILAEVLGDADSVSYVTAGIEKKEGENDEENNG